MPKAPREPGATSQETAVQSPKSESTSSYEEQQKVDKAALAKELSNWNSELQGMNDLGQFYFLDEQLEDPFGQHLAPGSNPGTQGALHDELLKRLARVSIKVGKFPMFDYDIVSSHEFAIFLTIPEQLMYYRYIVKEMISYRREIKPHEHEFFERCKVEVEYLESIVDLKIGTQVHDNPEVTNPLKPIRWMKSNGSLVYLFHLLSKAGYIDEADFRDRFEHGTNHFVDKSGNLLTKQDLQSAETNYKKNTSPSHFEKPREAPTLESIVRRLDE